MARVKRPWWQTTRTKKGISPADISSVCFNGDGQGIPPAGILSEKFPMARVGCSCRQGLSTPGGKPPGQKEGILPADISSVQSNGDGQGILTAGILQAKSPMTRVRCPNGKG